MWYIHVGLNDDPSMIMTWRHRGGPGSRSLAVPTAVLPVCHPHRVVAPNPPATRRTADVFRFGLRLWCLLLIALAPGLFLGRSQAGPLPEPKLLSAFPMGGNPGKELTVEVRGTALEGAYAARFDTDKLSADIERVEPIEPATEGEEVKQATPDRKYKAVLRLRIHEAAGAGLYWMRLITPNGLTDALRFRVNRDPVIEEVGTPHSDPQFAQRLDEFPVVVNGTFRRKAEADYYEFAVSAGERLRFEAYAGSSSTDPVLTLFAPTGSWHNPARLTRLAYNDEPTHYPGRSNEAVITYRFKRAGRYVLRVEPFKGGGGPDHVYQLRVIRPTVSEGAEQHRTRYFSQQTDPPLWEERSFTRPLPPNTIDVLWSRSSGRPDEEAARSPLPMLILGRRSPLPMLIDWVVIENSKPVDVSLPAFIEGAVESPGDIDRVRFKAKRGDGVAIEIETPVRCRPSGLRDGD